MTSFSELLQSAQQEADGLSVVVPADWMQGRSVFGGLQVAFALRAMRVLVPDAPLRTLQAIFVAPVAGSMRAHARILRQGKNVTQVEARIGDSADPQAVIVGAFGIPRSSAVVRTIAQPALETNPEGVIELPFASESGTTPRFSTHFNVRWLQGRPPFSGDGSFKHVLEIAMDDAGAATEAHLIAIADFIPPIALSHLKSAAPGSTLTWMLELLVDRIEAGPLRGFRVDAEMVAGRDGYTNQSVTIFAPDGTALALSHQTMLVFG